MNVLNAAYAEQTEPAAAAHGGAGGKRRAAIIMLMALCTFIPTAVAAIYYFGYAADRYVTEAVFSVHSEKPNSAALLGDMNYALTGGGSDKRDLLIVKEFIESEALLRILQERLDVKKLYRNPRADAVARLPDDVTNEEFLEYYRSRIKNVLNQDAGIITFSVSAFTPEDAYAMSDTALEVTEIFLNGVTERIRNDDLRHAETQLQETEEKVVTILAEINTFRKENNNIDPTMTGTGALGLITELEAEKAKTNAELAATSQILSGDTAAVKKLRNKIAALQKEIAKQKSKLVTASGQTPLSDVMQDYQTLLMRQDFALKRYEIALTAYESALVSAGKKTKYIVRIVEPSVADAPGEPDRIKSVLTVLIMSFLTVIIGGLLAASIRDHIAV